MRGMYAYYLHDIQLVYYSNIALAKSVNSYIHVHVPMYLITIHRPLEHHPEC